jgi:hypothetical protein
MNSTIVSEKLCSLTATGGLVECQASFSDFLEAAGLSKIGLANDLGLWPETVSRWGEVPPVYAIAYLELIVENGALRRKLNGGD